MQAIGSFLQAFFNSIATLLRFIFWFLRGLLNSVTVMTESVNIFGEIIDFLPAAVATTMLAVMGGLIAFRIFGRS